LKYLREMNNTRRRGENAALAGKDATATGPESHRKCWAENKDIHPVDGPEEDRWRGDA
jgi:hypothetical protein